MKSSFLPFMTSAALVGALGSGLCAPAQAIQSVYTLNFAPEAVGATGTGTGTLTYDSVARTLVVVSSFSGLSGTTTNAHIHAPTPSAGTGTAGVAIPFILSSSDPSGFPLGVTSGFYNTALNLALDSTYSANFLNTFGGGTAAGAEAALIASFNAGTAYYNIHTSTFGGGEIRAFATPVPLETDALPVVGGALFMAGGVWWKRKRLQAKTSEFIVKD
ncbi:MAG: CHRD domain-containing protein [Cyanobacteriota bacterium]|jgi:hypothetical protein